MHKSRNKRIFAYKIFTTLSKKVFYRYNPTSEEYERVYPSRSERVWSVTKRLLEAVGITAAIFIVLYIWVDLPKEKLLIRENRQLRDELKALDDRLNSAITVMDHLAERDNNFYRVIMQMDPLTPSQRYAGLSVIPSTKSFSGMNDRELVTSLTEKLGLYERQVVAQSMSFDRLAEAVNQNADRISHIPSIQPISEKDMTQMASGYGYRIDPIYGTPKYHEGMDFASPVGTPVYATGDGVVTEAGQHGAYGNLVEIDHGYNYVTRFAHLSKIKVHAGQHVKRGDLIGNVGSTGKSTGPHLHYEVRLKGVAQNPVNYYFHDLTPEEYAQMVNDSENAGHVMD